jgi:kynureninase
MDEKLLECLIMQARDLGCTTSGEEFAAAMDNIDPLRSFQSKFRLPRAWPHGADSPPATYFSGNSLGPMPIQAEVYVGDVMKTWGLAAHEGHVEGEHPWRRIDELCVPLTAQLVGAKENSEICIMNSLTVNLHLLFFAFYKPTKTRWRIAIEAGAFCSDSHLVRSQLELHGYDPATSLLELKPRAGEYTLRTEDIEATLNSDEASSIAVVLLPGVQFYTGQALDIKRITAAGHAHGIVVGWDLAHAIGNIPLSLHEWGCDFAAWCSYKYLSAGPGAIAGVFVHQRHSSSLHGLAGWWGQSLTDRFAMRNTHTPAMGAQSLALSNPAVLPMVCLKAALELHIDAAKENHFRTKSLKLTAYLEFLLRHHSLISTSAAPAVLLTPTDPSARGCQLSLLLNRPAGPINKFLSSHGIICDIREPNVLRVAPNPLYNTFADVYHFVAIFRQALYGTAF